MLKPILSIVLVLVAITANLFFFDIGQLQAAQDCHKSYPDVCIPSPPPDLDCKDISYRNFKVLPPDPHKFDRDQNGVGCER